MRSKGIIRVAMMGASLTVRGGITSVEKLIFENAPSTITFVHLPTFDHGSVLHNVFVYWTAIGKLCLFIARGCVDAVHIHFSDRGSTVRKLLPCIIATMFRCPFILHSHCAVHQEFYASIPPIAREIITAIFRKCTFFISLSKSWDVYFTQCLKLSQGQHCLLYNPVKIQEKLPDRDDHALVTFVFLGVLGPYKGANAPIKKNKNNKTFQIPTQNKGGFDCIQAFGFLPEELRKKSRMIIAGSGDIQTANDLITSLQLNEFVSIRQWLDPEKRDELLLESDVFLLPSYNEGLPMSMLEAMAFGLPVIVTPVGGIPEIVSQGREGLFVQPGRIDEIAHTMEFLILNKQERGDMGIRASLRVEPLRIEKYVDSLISLYKKAVFAG